MSSQPEAQHLTVDAEDAGQRLDNYLIRRLKGVPRSRIYRAIRSGEVRINGGRGGPRRKLASGDQVRVPPLRMAAGRDIAVGEDLARRLTDAIVFEDDDLLVLDKPAGLSVHGGTANPVGVIEALRAARPDLPFLELAHRLDRPTSGLLLLAVRRRALGALQGMMGGDHERRVRKRYTTLLAGAMNAGELRVDAPIRRVSGRHSGRAGRVEPTGRRSTTVFVALRRVTGCTLAHAELFSGRIHQIRIHAAHAGHPVAGDDAYGDPDLNARLAALGLTRLFLHASHLALYHPRDGRPLEFHSPLAADLAALLERLAGADLAAVGAADGAGRQPSARHRGRAT